MSFTELSEQEIIRRNTLDEIKKLGIDPYPAEGFDVNVNSKEILDNYDPEKKNYQDVSIAGRIMTRRIMGSASFAEIQDEKGRIQIYLRRDDICPSENKDLYNTFFKRLLDIGDIIGVKGYVFVTQMGEISIHVREIKILSNNHKLAFYKGQRIQFLLLPKQ